MLFKFSHKTCILDQNRYPKFILRYKLTPVLTQKFQHLPLFVVFEGLISESGFEVRTCTFCTEHLYMKAIEIYLEIEAGQ